MSNLTTEDYQRFFDFSSEEPKDFLEDPSRDLTQEEFYAYLGLLCRLPQKDSATFVPFVCEEALLKRLVEWPSWKIYVETGYEWWCYSTLKGRYQQMYAIPASTSKRRFL